MHYVPRWQAARPPSEDAKAKWALLASRGDFTQAHMPAECFVPTEGHPPGKVRDVETYRSECCEGLKVPMPGRPVLPEHRAEHEYLTDEEIQALGRCIYMKAEAIWVKGSPQTVARGFRRDMLIRGEPVSQAPMVKSGEHSEWWDGDVAKAYQRGHYMAGESNWGSPAFRVFSGASRKPRMVIDYRRVNRLTVRAVFLMPDSVAVKRAAAGHQWFSTGDGVAGFNQILNTDFASRVLAVVTLSGKHLPRTLGFGPSNGPSVPPEAVQDMAFVCG